MDDTLKHRIIGIIVLIASAALFIPLLFKSAHPTPPKPLDVVVAEAPLQPELSQDNLPKATEPTSAIDAVADNSHLKPAAEPILAANKPDASRPAVDDGLDMTDPAEDEPPAVVEAAPQAASPAAKVAAVAPKPEPVQEPAQAVATMDEEPIVSAPAAPQISPVKLVHTKVVKTPVTKIASKKPAIKPLAKPHSLAAVESKPSTIGQPHAYQPASAQPVVATAQPAGTWVVQCASFSANEHAIALQTALKQAGFNAFIKQGHTATGPISRVFVGTATNRETAVALQHALQANHTQAIVVNSAVLRG